jgi:hypothetical protein
MERPGFRYSARTAALEPLRRLLNGLADTPARMHEWQ